MKIQGLKLLVTGGAGFIGSNLVDALVASGNSVVVLDNFSSGKMENLAHLKNNAKVNVVKGDVRDAALTSEITKGVDCVYHLAVQCLRVSIRNPIENHEVNATGTLNLLKASSENKVKRFVYVSSSEAYGTAMTAPMTEGHPLLPMTVYGASKAAGELYTLAYWRTYGLAGMIVRPFNTYGPREHFEGAYGEVIPKFVLRLLNGMPPVIFGDGKQTRDFTYVADTAAGIIAASGCDAMIGEAVNVARGVEVSIKDLASIIAKKLGKGIAPVFETQRPGDVSRHYAGVEKATRLFGFTADVGIDEGIDKYIKWFTSQGYDHRELIKEEKVFNWE